MNNLDNPSMAAPKKEYRYIIDPGHGWLEVPQPEIAALNIEDKISAFSYISEDGQTVYLEEDCDLSIFLIAMRQNFDIVEVYQDDTFVRALDHYHDHTRR